MGKQPISADGRAARRLLWAGLMLAALWAALSMAQAHAAPRARARLSPSIVCPVLAARAGARLCCGPPVDRPIRPPCCPSNAAARPAVQPICCPAVCQVSITISSRPNPVRAGRPVTVDGLVKEGSGLRVELWQRRAGQRTFSELATTTTSASGAFAFKRPADAVLRDTYWYATAGSGRSATIEELVRAIVTLRAARVRLPRGAVLRLTGTVSPPRRGGRAEVLARLGHGRWRVAARPLLAAGRRFVLRLRLLIAGRWRVRALMPSDAANLQGSSRTITIRVL